MTRRSALAAAVASVLFLAATGVALADSGGPEGTAPPGHAMHQMHGGGGMQGAGMEHGSHEMHGGGGMQGAGMEHGSHEMQGGGGMQGAGMEHGSHEMQGGGGMQGAGMEHGSHQGEATGVGDRPRALALGGFALANAIVLLAAAVVRHRDRSRPGRARAAARGAR